MYQPCFSDFYPSVWLFTDARNDHRLEQTIAALPRGCGIVFRHYHLPSNARRQRFQTIKALAARADHILLLADSAALARQWGADGVHGRQWKRSQTIGLLHSAPVHNAREIRQAHQIGADLLFLSPAFGTRSHPGEKPLHRAQLRRLIAMAQKPVLLLGGVDNRKFGHMSDLGAQGWAAIDGLTV
ncbi:MAG: thiamine phosphate synthase [Parasphingorhabdus sp.]|uniref:thiamine phosphate synthase n=1 Tax=Parasphingorhabdus sp. TaxID=2709688 RepID=UPI00329A2733